MKDNEEKYLRKYHGLSAKEVIASREKYGKNKLEEDKKESIIIKILSIFKEPMFLLLLIAASIYFIVGEYADGIIMLIFVLGICTIEFIEESKTEKALEELNKLSALNVKVIRNGKKEIISSEEIVVGDIVILEEGDQTPADGKVLYSQSLGLNESTLTGETDIVYKNTKEDKENHFKLNYCYSSTNVTNGYGIVRIENVGVNTEIGKIGKSLNEIEKEKTPLEKQINKLVLICTIFSAIVFIFTIIINFMNHPTLPLKERIVESILAGITIAMATIPEEIPVILTVFLAMGAWDLTKQNTLTKNMKAIETLGKVNVLCTDKTGTITENKMKVEEIYEHNKEFKEVAHYACPLLAYDPMEIAIKNYLKSKIKTKKYKNIIKEYAFTPETKMMGILWDNNKLCVKGAYESVLPLCDLDSKTYKVIEDKINEYTQNGYRVIAVASKENLENIPKKIENARLNFNGLLVLNDPPRYGIKKSIFSCNTAGIRVIMITGDNGETARGIAKNIGIKNYEKVITGQMLEKMTDEELFEKVKETNIFARVYPKHKMRIVSALQKDNKIVAMTGDGVNDATALKKSDIGIAMGKRGTNVAKESADIILLDDNFNTITAAIAKGRNIYKNIRKAISYIIVIHIPIALLSLFIPIFKLPTLMEPIHIMFLELLIDPTSSIIFQRIKTEKDIMLEKPRKPDEPIINKITAIRSIMQGLLIFIVTFINYILLLKNNINQNVAITITYTTLVLSIILISFELKSKESTIKSIINSLKDKLALTINLGIIICLLALIYIPFLNKVANTTPLNLLEWLYIFILTSIAVIPFDLLKLKKKH